MLLAASGLVSIVGYACADDAADANAPADEAPAEPVAETSEALLNQVVFPDNSCTPTQRTFLLDSIRRGRAIAESDAFETCMRSVMAGPTPLPGDPHLGRAVPDLEGPYYVCGGDPQPADPAGAVIALTRSNLGISIKCTPTSAPGVSAFAGVTTNPGANESLTYVQTSLDSSIASSDQNYVAETIWHEAMHQHGYNHSGGSGLAQDCGYAANAFPDNDALWMRRHTVPYLVTACMVYLGDISDTCRQSLSCKPDEVPIRAGFSTSASCVCGHDPGWHALPAGGSMKQLAIARDTTGALEVAGLAATNGNVSIATQAQPNGETFGGWQSLGASSIQHITIGPNQDGRLEVFAVGGNGALYHAWQNAARVWGGWQSLGRSDLKQVAVTTSPNGVLSAYALTTSGAVVRTSQVGPNGGWGGQWESLGGSALTALRVGNNADGRPEVFAIGSNKALYHQWQWGGTTTWSGWSSLGRNDVDQVALANENDGTLTAYVRAGGAIYATSQIGPNGGWPGAWTPLWGSGLRDLSAGRGSDGLVRVFAVGNDNQAYVTVESQPRGAFNSWALVPGTATFKSLVVGTDQAGRANVVGLDTSGNVRQVAVP